MRKARITVPAVCTNLGPGIESLGLALSLHVTATFIERGDTQLIIDTRGEGGADMPTDCYHPVMYAALRVFQVLEDAPFGLLINIHNQIPVEAGLGAEAAMTVAGLMGANSLMGSPLHRDDLIAIGADIQGRADGIVTAMLGGLTVSTPGAETILYRRMDVSPFKVLVVYPEIEGYESSSAYLPQTVNYASVLHNLGRQVLVAEALRQNDFELLEQVLSDRVLEPQLRSRIPGLQDAIKAAKQAGAAAATICGEGPSLLIFTAANHYRVADAVQSVFDSRDVLSRVWTLTVDTQGVVMTAAETFAQ